ncbi:orange carotenoid protein N-terminal domain-containing protein [Pseudanabaena sp. FACHB-2040]|uniref:orange carotenoid protein N-terminal domain-containing protein n=1 Tax=Pseudanabaena sp. FACHB-2040 TaxID=2692859 RepID=UPI001681D0FE|nr:orange carotenoid protein N-terminal domain-containing protein [Pseudanabaena sp. FACHB-2040]MBD2258660.1 Orange carotenoid protein [Pseudanabaena sp. FACHB-2040]
MTYTTDNQAINQPLEKFQQFDADTQLALLWFGYLDIKDQLNPAPGADVETLGQALVDQVKAMPKEEQLQAQRDVATGADTPVSRGYGALSSSVKLEFWLLLAQCMEEGSVINVPSDYELPENTSEFVGMIQQLDLEDRVTFTRSAVSHMGFKTGQ